MSEAEPIGGTPGGGGFGDMQPPGHWPQRLAFVLGVLCFAASVYTSQLRRAVGTDRGRVEAELERQSRALAQSGAQGSAQESESRDVVSGLRRSADELRTLEAWRGRQTMGLILAGVVLWFGASVGAGLRRIYDKRPWLERDPPEDQGPS